MSLHPPFAFRARYSLQAAPKAQSPGCTRLHSRCAGSSAPNATRGVTAAPCQLPQAPSASVHGERRALGAGPTTNWWHGVTSLPTSRRCSVAAAPGLPAASRSGSNLGWFATQKASRFLCYSLSNPSFYYLVCVKHH